jgi:hypothetical protein
VPTLGVTQFQVPASSVPAGGLAGQGYIAGIGWTTLPLDGAAVWPPTKVGKWIDNRLTAAYSADDALAITASTTIYFPIFLPVFTRVDSFAVALYTSNINTNLGVYTMTAAGRPGSAIARTTVASKAYSTMTTATVTTFSIAAGWAFLALGTPSANTMMGVPQWALPALGSLTTPDRNYFADTYYAENANGGVLQDPAPTVNGRWNTSELTAPVMYLRVAA